MKRKTIKLIECSSVDAVNNLICQPEFELREVYLNEGKPNFLIAQKIIIWDTVEPHQNLLASPSTYTGIHHDAPHLHHPPPYIFRIFHPNFKHAFT
jgi:hypothetical protein